MSQFADRPKPSSKEYFDEMFSKNDDPWGFATRRYESRKRDLTLAALPHEKYEYGFEPACATGELSFALAARCDRLLVSDGVDKAIELSRRRLAGIPNVEVQKLWVPDQWPAQQFDLIVLGEFLFYLTPEAVREVAACVSRTLKTNGTVLACHWRLPIEDCVVTGDSAHEMLDQELALPCVSSVIEREFRIDVWTAAPTLATIEGLK